MQVGRNDPCPCGSGKKHKKCCLAGGQTENGDLLWRQMGAIDKELGIRFLEHAVRTFGHAALEEAWEEFWIWEPEKPFTPDSIELQLFLPYFFYGWTPDVDTQTLSSAPEDTTVAQDYFEKRAGYLSPLERRYIEACIAAPFSFHDVVSVTPGQGFTLKDIFLGTEIDVAERSGSRNANVGDIFFGKIIQLDHVATAVGSGWVMIPPARKISILELRQHLREGTEKFGGEITINVLHDYDIEIRELFLDLQRAVLAPPTFTNTDGELLVLHKITYTIDSPQTAFNALKDLALIYDEKQMLQDAEYDGNGQLKKTNISWHKSGNKKHKEWSNTVLGHLEINGTELKIDVNSANRAKKIRKEIEKRMGKSATHRSTTLQSPESLMRDRDQVKPQENSDEHNELMKNPEIKAQMQAMMDKHWENWFHERIPALGNRTPLDAAKDSDGRELLEALFAEYTRRSETSNVPQPNWNKMKERLGLRQ